MLPVEDLHWTTRAGVCARLTELLISSSPTSSSLSDPSSYETNQRRCVASLLATIAEDTCAPALREILLNPHEDRYVRLIVTEALARLGELADPPNVAIARHIDERPESQGLLIERWRQAKGDERRRLHAELSDDEGELTAAVAHNPQEMRELAEAFVLSYEGLAAHFGSDQVLLDQIEASIRNASRHLRAGCDHACLRRVEAARATWLLGELGKVDVRPRIASMLGCPDLHPRLSDDLFFILYDLDRAQAEALARRLAESAGNNSFACDVLHWMKGKLRPAQRCFLLWAGRQPDRALRYGAVERVDAAGGRLAEWRGWLEERSRDEDPFVRLRATAALVHRGLRLRLPEIVHAATEADHVLLRGEAIRLLGIVHPEAHVELFRRALLEDREKSQHCSMPAAEAAVVALARLGTPAALTALLQGYFVPWGEELPNIIEQRLEILLQETRPCGRSKRRSVGTCGYTLRRYLEGKTG
jgi:HEAT repeat protein